MLGSLSCPRQLWGFRFLVCKMEAMRIRAVSLAVVNMESGDGSEEELEEEEEKEEEEGAFMVFKQNNPFHTCHGIGRCC